MIKTFIAKLFGRHLMPPRPEGFFDVPAHHPQAFLFYRAVHAALREHPSMLVAVRAKRTTSGAVVPFGNGVYRLLPAEYLALSDENSDIVTDWQWQPAKHWLERYSQRAVVDVEAIYG